MKPKAKLARIMAVLVAISFFSAGCGGGGEAGGTGGQRVVLKVWKTFEDSENLQELFAAYQAKNPNVEIVYTKKNVENYEEDLLDALATGDGPDIFSINNSWLPKYLDKVSPAPERILNFNDFKNTFVDAVVRDFAAGNKVYGTAMSVDSLALYYNKDLLGTSGIATPAKTWSDLSSHVQAIKRSDGRGYFTRSGAALGTNSNINRAVDIVYLMMLQKGAVPFSSDGQSPQFAQAVFKNGNYSNPAEEALSFYTSFASPASPNYNWNLRSDYSIDAFANGRAAYLYSYSYTRQTLKQKSPNLNYDVAPVPQPNLEDPAVNFANYWGEVVSKQSKNANWAWDFLKFMTSKESLDRYYAKNKQPSSRKDLIELQIPDPEIGVFANANLTARSFFKPDQARMDSIFGRLIDNVILNGLSFTEALTQAEQQSAILIRDNWQ